MFLTVTSGGKPVWRLKYRLGGKEQLYTLGTYPALGLSAARQERDRLKQQFLDAPMNLTAVREDKVRLSLESSGNTFRLGARRGLPRLLGGGVPPIQSRRRQPQRQGRSSVY